MHAFHRGRKFEKHRHPRLERLGSCDPLLGGPRPAVLRPPLGILVREDVGKACIILGRVTSMKCIERERSVGWGLVAGHIRWTGRMGCVGRRVPERGRHESSEAAMNRHGVVRGDGVEVLVCRSSSTSPGKKSRAMMGESATVYSSSTHCRSSECGICSTAAAVTTAGAGCGVRNDVAHRGTRGKAVAAVELQVASILPPYMHTACTTSSCHERAGGDPCGCQTYFV
jgi:hypothetical protein